MCSLSLKLSSQRGKIVIKNFLMIHSMVWDKEKCQEFVSEEDPVCLRQQLISTSQDLSRIPASFPHEEFVLSTQVGFHFHMPWAWRGMFDVKLAGLWVAAWLWLRRGRFGWLRGIASLSAILSLLMCAATSLGTYFYVAGFLSWQSQIDAAETFRTTFKIPILNPIIITKFY